MTDEELERFYRNLKELGRLGPRRYILIAGVVTPCDDLASWAEWMEYSPDRVVAVDRDEADGPDGTRVSTVFFGLSLNGDDADRPPLIFETMVFGGVLDGTTQRYTSLVDAMAGHQAMCRRVMQTER